MYKINSESVGSLMQKEETNIAGDVKGLFKLKILQFFISRDSA